MTGNFHAVYRATVLGTLIASASCDRFGWSNSEQTEQRREEQRLEDQKERDAVVERMKAAAIAQEQKQEPIKKLQTQIDALEEKISDARSRGKDWRPLEKEQEALEAQRDELLKH